MGLEKKRSHDSVMEDVLPRAKIHFELSKQRNGKKKEKVLELNVVCGDLKHSQNI